jgi:hypothetical protein
MRELAAVHRIEQARLLARASRMRCESTPIGRAFVTLCGGDEVESEWRRDAASEIDACWLDGWKPAPELSDAAERRGWARTSARALARAAWTLEPSIARRLQIARAELCEGSVDVAWNAVRACASERATDACRREISESLALASEVACRWSDSERAYAALSARAETRSAALAALLALALRNGEIARAEMLREHWLGEIARNRAARSTRADVLEKLRARVRFHRRMEQWTLSQSASAWLDAWVARDRELPANQGCLAQASLALALVGRSH